VSLSNSQLAEVLARAAEQQEAGSNKARALLRAAHQALAWPVSVASLVEAGQPLTDLPAVGPYVAGILLAGLEAPPPDGDPPPERNGFSSLAEARELLRKPGVVAPPVHADFQMHSTDSDGAMPLADVISLCLQRGRRCIAITDHTKGLRIANGMDEARLRAQGEVIDRINAELQSAGSDMVVLRSVEMNLSPEGEGDMEWDALCELDLVLGAFHSKLRLRDDQTDRYLAGIRNPAVDVLAHPRTRMYSARAGLQADWRRVFAEAARLDKAVEVDGHSNRQDLDVDLLALVREEGARVSIGSDAHAASEHENLDLGVAAVVRAGIPTDRIINCLSPDEVRAWARAHRER
jgi:histidinol phosphatase-like PHP family hydrolase